MIQTIERTETPQQREWEAAFRAWRNDPMSYVDSVLLPRLGVTLDESQRQVLKDVFTHKKVLIPTHFAFGKSFLCAVIAVTIANLYPHDCVGTTLAPTFLQVKDIIWSEINAIYEKVNSQGTVLWGKVTTTRLDIGPKCKIVGMSPRRGAKGSDDKQNLQGRHAMCVLVIVDEAGGVDKQIFDQVARLESAGHVVYVIYIGNPVSSAGEFGQMCLTEKGEGFKLVHKVAYAAPNMRANGLTSIEAVRQEAARLRALDQDSRRAAYEDRTYKKPFPMLLSPGWVMRHYMKWGESALFFSHCIGEWAETAEDVLVTLKRANECMLGTATDVDGNKYWMAEEAGVARWNGVRDISAALDCSGEGIDKKVLYALEGNRECHYKTFAKTWDTNTVDFRGTKLREDGPYVARYIYENLFMANIGRKVKLAIDCTGGYGDTVYDALMTYPLDPEFITIRKINFGSKAMDEETYVDIIAEMAWTLAKAMNSTDGLLLEPNDDLKNQVTARKTMEGSKHRNMLEPKGDFKKRAGQSPDDFDALMMAVYTAAGIADDGDIEWDDRINKAQAGRTSIAAGILRRGSRSY